MAVDAASLSRVTEATLFILRFITVSRVVSKPSREIAAEMIIALSYQAASACSALEETLCQRDTGWYPIFEHLLDSKILVLVDICLISLVPLHLCARRKGAEQKSQTYDVCFDSIHTAKI